jgi:hypothetical protein
MSHPPHSLRWPPFLGGALLLAAVVYAGSRALPVEPAPPARPQAQLIEIEEYDLDTAFNLAGEQVPVIVESYYFDALIDEGPPEKDASELADKLRQAAAEHDFIGITGYDPLRNRAALLKALESLDGVDLRGLVVIYLGPAEHRTEIIAALRLRGIEPRYVVYPRVLPVA